MNTHPGWEEIAIRLVLTVIAGALIGRERGERGRSAGFRTTILVCLTASVSMILAELILAETHQNENSTIRIDPMRLPLGVLSGMGFIGAGAIMRRGAMVSGVTTAATLWYVTPMGLCFGAGQLMLGLIMLCLGLIVLTPLRWADSKIPKDRQALLTLISSQSALTVQQICDQLQKEDYRILSCGITYIPETRRRKVKCLLQWSARPDELHVPKFLHSLSETEGVDKVEWDPRAM